MMTKPPVTYFDPKITFLHLCTCKFLTQNVDSVKNHCLMGYSSKHISKGCHERIQQEHMQSIINADKMNGSIEGELLANKYKDVMHWPCMKCDALTASLS